MFPLLLCSTAVIYSMCVIFVRAAMASAPEAFEDDAGFHYVPGSGLRSAHAYVVIPI